MTESELVGRALGRLFEALERPVEPAELVFGRARLNNDGGQAWHWKHDLLAGPGADGGQRRNVSPLPPGPDAEPDALVRLRRDVSEQSTHQMGGGA